jgi:hypothetical protein
VAVAAAPTSAAIVLRIAVSLALRRTLAIRSSG